MKKKYLCITHEDSRMGYNSSNHHIVSESQLKDFNLYADYIYVYELVSDKPLSKTKKKKLGMKFSG